MGHPHRAPAHPRKLWLGGPAWPKALKAYGRSLPRLKGALAPDLGGTRGTEGRAASTRTIRGCLNSQPRPSRETHVSYCTVRPTRTQVPFQPWGNGVTGRAITTTPSSRQKTTGARYDTSCHPSSIEHHQDEDPLPRFGQGARTRAIGTVASPPWMIKGGGLTM